MGQMYLLARENDSFEAKKSVFQSCGTEIADRERYKHNKSMDEEDSDSEEEESYNEDFEPPVVRLLRTMSSLRNDDKKRAALDMLLQLD